MTDISPEPAAGGPGDDIPDDLSDLFADPAVRDRLEKEARDAVRGTRAGRADATTGTPRDLPAPLPIPEAGGLVFDDEDDDQEHGAVPAPRTPAEVQRTWKDAFPEGTFDSGVWAHRRKVLLHKLAWHAGHTHVYMWRLTRLSALGVGAGLRDGWHYYSAQEYAEMVDTARRKKMTPDMVAALREERLEYARARRREPMLIGATTGVLTAVAAAVAVAQVYGLLAASPAAMLTLGVLSALGLREHRRRNPDQPLTAAFAVPHGDDDGHLPLTDDMLNRVLRTAKVLKDDQEIILVEPIRAAEINGVEAKFRLPKEVTFSQLMAKKEAIANALDIEERWLDIRKDGSANRVSFWYCTADPFGTPRVSPLMDNSEQTDVWRRGILIGFNRRGLPIYLKLRHVMALLGGMSRTGKGMLLRNLLCGLGLDPRANLRLVAGAKPGEHRGYAPVCSTFFGRRPERLITLLEALLAEAYRREDILEDQARAKFGEKDLPDFPLEILVIDEYKQYANSSKRLPDPSDEEGKRTFKAADRIAELLEELAAFAAALNITVLVVTQDPDANTIPRGFKSNSGARVATRTGGPTQTNAILKEGATGAGLRAHEIPESMPGGAIVDIDGAPGELIRSFFIEDEEFDGAADIIAAGLALRMELGRAPGQFSDPIEDYLLRHTGLSSSGGGPNGSGRPGPLEAGGEWTEEETTILDLMLDAFAKAGDVDRLRTGDLLVLLADLDPDTWSYEALGVEEVPEDQDGHKAAVTAYNRAGGRRLAEEIAAALEGTDRELVTREWTTAPRGRGYLLAEVRTAAGIAPE
ncbi:hypothetical protein [Streptomyces hydrogenans]|uniref:hypothetical protein n=1 Tax=Streptomyces hydrogenans TaxID=1873719 RepID=UPI00341DE01E